MSMAGRKYSILGAPGSVAGDGDVFVRVRVFGLNHDNTYMRSGVWPFGISVFGIEAAGTVEHDPSGRLHPGTAVVAIVGGMARDRNGSYAELVSVGRATSCRWSPPRLGGAGRDPQA